MHILLDHVTWLGRLWRDAKRWHHLPVGPVNFTFKLTRRWRPRTPLLLKKRIKDQAAGSGSAPARGESATARAANTVKRKGPAVIVGVGPGLGEAAAALFAQHGFPVALVSRSSNALSAFADNLRSPNNKVRAYPCDVTDERLVIALMRQIEADLGCPELVIYAVQASTPGSLLSSEATAFEECWRANCFGAFLVAREAARTMKPRGKGTILFAGATSGTIGRQGYVNFAPGKFGLRALAQVIARELWPDGIHVAHVVIDGDIAENEAPDNEPHIKPDELAAIFLSLHLQPKSCWASEIDVRPAEERFWEHC